MEVRCDDYLRMGTPTVWIVDPWKRGFFTLKSDGIVRKTETLLLAGSSIAITQNQIFEDD